MGVRASEEGCPSIGVSLSLEAPLQRGKLAFKERERNCWNREKFQNDMLTEMWEEYGTEMPPLWDKGSYDIREWGGDGRGKMMSWGAAITLSQSTFLTAFKGTRLASMGPFWVNIPECLIALIHFCRKWSLCMQQTVGERGCLFVSLL